MLRQAQWEGNPQVELPQGNDMWGESNVHNETPPATKSNSLNQQGEQEAEAVAQGPPWGTTVTPTLASQE